MAPGPHRPACGAELAAGKTLPDPRALHVELTRDVEIEDVLAEPTPPLRVDAQRRTGVETTIFELDVRLVGFSRQADGDVRLVVADPRRQSRTFIVEFPTPHCLIDVGDGRRRIEHARAALAAACGRARADFTRLGGRATVTGMGFFSMGTGEIGEASNGFELRPALDFGTVRCARLSDPVLLAVGDIAACTGEGDEATASLVDEVPGAIATLGDNTEDGDASEFSRCYEPSWGRHRWRTRPAAGDGEYETHRAAGYFGYFGERAGAPDTGYYAYDLGAWHVVVLNSNCAHVGGCETGSPQEQWLRLQLAAHPRRCSLVYWHHPLVSSSRGRPNELVRPLWQALHDYGVDVVLNAHDNVYERFAPQSADGVADRRGIRAFVVGTGGSGETPPLPRQPVATSEVREVGADGILELTLHPASYEWRFVPTGGETFTDAGAGVCH